MTRARPKDEGSRLITPALLKKWPLPALDGARGKEDRGSVFVVGGSQECPGAVMLAALGALRAGAGKLDVATARSVAAQVGIAVPEARVRGLVNGHDDLTLFGHRKVTHPGSLFAAAHRVSVATS